MAIYNIEVQDENGNVYNPHTKAAVVFLADGTTTESTIANHIASPVHTASFTHSRSSTTHLLTGVLPSTGIVTCTFKATANFTEGDSFSVNGSVYTAKPNGEETALPANAFVRGDIVSVNVDIVGKKLGFKLGGGGGSSGGFPKPWQEAVTAPAREAIAKNDAIVYQEFGDLLTLPTALTPRDGTSLSNPGQISGNGEYVVCTSPNSTNTYVVKIDKVTDTYYKLPELPSQPMLVGKYNIKHEMSAISNDGSIIAFMNSVKTGALANGNILYDYFIEYYTKNSNETYTKCSDFKYCQSRGDPYDGNPRFATFVGHDNLFIRWENHGYTLINFTNKETPKIVSSSNGDYRYGYSNAAVDYSGCFLMAQESYGQTFPYHFYYSPDGGATTPMKEIGTYTAEADNSMYSNYISGTAGYAIMSYTSHPQGGNLGKYIQISPNGVVATAAEDSFSNMYTSFFTSDGRYFMYEQSSKTKVYDASTIPILSKAPLSTFNFGIIGMEYMSSNGEYAYANDGKIYRMRKKTHIQKLDSVYSLSLLSKNDTFKVGLGISLQNANVGQDCKANLFAPINNKLGSLV